MAIINEYLQLKPSFLELLDKRTLPGYGICGCVYGELDDIIALFSPTDNDREEILKKEQSLGYWAYGGKKRAERRVNYIDHTRAMFICFMAAVNNEL